VPSTAPGSVCSPGVPAPVACRPPSPLSVGLGVALGWSVGLGVVRGSTTGMVKSGEPSVPMTSVRPGCPLKANEPDG